MSGRSSALAVTDPGLAPERGPGPHQETVRDAPRCPHCSGRRVHRHGSFPLRDGTRQPRYRCLACGRTFNQFTRTPVAYLKKRDRWPKLAVCIASGLTVRDAAEELRVRPATAFHWRHRMLAPMARRSLPALEGLVSACEALIPYSEKGSWRSNGPGSRRKGLPPKPLFRRLIDGKPSWAVVTSAGPSTRAVVVSQGVPNLEQLRRGLAAVLGTGAQLCFSGRGPYEEACHQLQIPNWKAWTPGVGFQKEWLGVDQVRGRLYWWLRRFHRVATRYLNHYLAWHLLYRHAAGLTREIVVRQLLAASTTPAGQAV